MTSPTKRAILICPSYSSLPEKYWLSGTVLDIQAVKNVIITKCGFEENNVTILQNDKATKDNITTTLQEFTCNRDDVVFVYYSGHGVFMEDSKDEGLFPTVKTWPLEGYLEEICITGQDFVPFFNKLSQKNAHCTMIFDCCHSGQLYRVTEFKETNLKPRQFIATRKPDGAGGEIIKQFTKANRGGWSPKDKDRFYYIAACTPTQVALEEINKGGRLTMALVNVLNSLESPQTVSYDALFRLIQREFRSHGWSLNQTPQYESANVDTVLFGNSEVTKQEKAIEIKEVINDDQVLVNAGFVQGLTAGKYMVFDVTATADSFRAGKDSKDWLAIIDVNEGDIAGAEALGFVLEKNPDKTISVGCLACLHAPDSIRESVYVKAQESASLVSYLKETNMFNVLTHEPSQSDKGNVYIITREQIKEKECWVTRDHQTGRMVLPPILVGSERDSVVAENLCRYQRYYIGLQRASSELLANEKLPFDISFKVYKVEKIPAISHFNRERIACDGVANGIDIRTVVEKQPTFKSHQQHNGRLVNGTGDGFVFQVTNNNSRKEDTVHICIMLYQFDGAIKALYPPKTGKTAELRGAGDTTENVFRVFIPTNSLRVMVEPDQSKGEPSKGVNKLVLYASNHAVDYSPLIQTSIECDPDIIARGNEEKSALSGLDAFLKVNKRCIPDDELQEQIAFHIQQEEIVVVK